MAGQAYAMLCNTVLSRAPLWLLPIMIVCSCSSTAALMSQRAQQVSQRAKHCYLCHAALSSTGCNQISEVCPCVWDWLPPIIDCILQLACVQCLSIHTGLLLAYCACMGSSFVSCGTFNSILVTSAVAVEMPCNRTYREAPGQTALERQDLPCTYLAHHEPESVFVSITNQQCSLPFQTYLTCSCCALYCRACCKATRCCCSGFTCQIRQEEGVFG